jgi:hypothetical protein
MMQTLMTSLVGYISMHGDSLNLTGQSNSPFNPFDPIVEGNNTCYMTTGYFPKD